MGSPKKLRYSKVWIIIIVNPFAREKRKFKAKLHLVWIIIIVYPFVRDKWKFKAKLRSSSGAYLGLLRPYFWILHIFLRKYAKFQLIWEWLQNWLFSYRRALDRILRFWDYDLWILHVKIKKYANFQLILEMQLGFEDQRTNKQTQLLSFAKAKLKKWLNLEKKVMEFSD